MSMYIHSQQDFLEVAKFFLSNEILDPDAVFPNLTATYCNQVIASNVRYHTELIFEIDFTELDTDNDIKILTEFEALRRLDSMIYQLSESEYLGSCGAVPATNLIKSILIEYKLHDNYKDFPEYKKAKTW